MNMKRLMAFVAIFALVASSFLVLAEKGPIERIDVIHYKDGTAKVLSPAKAKLPSASCYSANYWISTPVSYSINPGMGMDVVAVSSSAITWDDATSAVLFNPYTITTKAEIAPDYENVIFFGPYPDARVIGVTSFWVNTLTKQIIQWDMELNTYFTWGDATVNPEVMDIQNIATHELGHTLGLGDLYRKTCTAVTMYGYSSEGDTQKRTLEPADIAGLQKIYG